MTTSLTQGGKNREGKEYDAGSSAMEAIAYFVMVYNSLSDDDKKTLKDMRDFNYLYSRIIRSDGYINRSPKDMNNAIRTDTSLCVEVLASSWKKFQENYSVTLRNIKISSAHYQEMRDYSFSCVLSQIVKPNFGQCNYYSVTPVQSTVPDFRHIAPDLHQEVLREWQQPFTKGRPYMPILDADVNGLHEQAFKKLANVLLEEIQRMQNMCNSRYRDKLTRYKEILNKLSERFDGRVNKPITAQSIKRFEAAFKEIAQEHTGSFARFFSKPASEQTYQAYITSKTQP